MKVGGRVPAHQDEADGSMWREAWQTLVEAGLPLGPARRRHGMPALTELAASTLVIGQDLARISHLEREALHAFLRGWRQHWRASFDEYLGPPGQALIDALATEAVDADRYLKLKRIAVAHLARAL